MNKRQKKKNLKKLLPLIAWDETPLLTMTEKEYETAIKKARAYQVKYGFRKKYKNLKSREKYLRYCYSAGESYEKALTKFFDVATKVARTYNPMNLITVTQDISKLKGSYDTEGKA